VDRRGAVHPAAVLARHRPLRTWPRRPK
jgi:hypothetical protein